MNTFVRSVINACIELNSRLQAETSDFYTYHSLGAGGDISRGIDLIAEAIFYRHLSSFGSIYSEESGWMDSNLSSIHIVLDPIDGSDNFISKIPYYGVSVARMNSENTTEAVVANLANGEIFVRTQKEYYTLSLHAPEEKKDVIINLSAKVGLFEKAPEHPELVRKLMTEKLKFRSPGALALSLAYAPYVKYVLFLGTMRPYDIQAGLYLSRHLYVYNDERYILISADKEIFEQIRLIVEKEYF